MRLALVLGAGGHPGYPFQLAVLDAIERELAIDLRDAELMVGTSVGAMTALLLRAGFSVADLLAIAHGRPASDHAEHLLHEVLDPPGQLPPELPGWRPPSLRTTGPRASLGLLTRRGNRRRHTVPGAAANLFPTGRASHAVLGHAANSLFQHGWPDRPTWVVAMRTRDGRRSVFGHDVIPSDVGAAVMASSAIPGWFNPVLVDGVRHVDAGVRSTTNADLVAAHGKIDLAIVVPPMAIDRPRAALLDQPVRWLVNAQIRNEVEKLDAAGIPVVVATPNLEVARTLQGDPIRMNQERVDRVLTATTPWAEAWSRRSLIGVRPIIAAAG